MAMLQKKLICRRLSPAGTRFMGTLIININDNDNIHLQAALARMSNMFMGTLTININDNYNIYLQAALARMSNMFMGTLTIKGPKTSTAMGMSLEEMDRPVRIVIVIVM